MDKTKIGVAVVLVVVLSVGVGYAYITGMGPLEEDPTAGLEEPPETETTYDFGEVPETGSDSEGGQASDGNAQTNPESDDSDSVAGDGTDNSEKDTEGQPEGETDEGNSDGDGTEAGTVANSESQRTDESDEDDSDDGTGGGGDGDGVDGDGTEDTERRTGTLQASAQTTYTGQPFVPELENMEKCGETCREATVALQNKMDVDAENVVVYVRLYAGDSTDPEDVVWGENRELGTLAPGEVYRETETVDLSPQQANKVRETDGVVTAKATVASDQATATFVEQDSVE